MRRGIAAAFIALALRAGNPVFPGWYADPDAVRVGEAYWVFPTFSAPYGRQTFLDAFSSPDLVHWTKHPRVLDAAAIPWVKRALWAPSAAIRDGRHYLFFAANDIQKDGESGGIGVAVADRPEGPYRDLLGGPLLGRFVNGAQPIDPCFFRDADGTPYLLYGGWGHCNIARLKEDFTGFVPFPDGTTFREITPEHYVEGVYMLLRQGRYYLMWSEGGWTGPDYCVAYAVADAPTGPFRRVGKILEQDPAVATGAGHHSMLRVPRAGGEDWFIVYHRHPLGDTDGNHRVVCVDRLEFDAQGLIRPVKITREGVPETRP